MAKDKISEIIDGLMHVVLLHGQTLNYKGSYIFLKHPIALKSMALVLAERRRQVAASFTTVETVSI